MREHGDRVDLDEIAVVEFGHRNHGARRARLSQPRCINLVEARPVADADDVGGHPDEIVRGSACGFQDRQHVVDGLPRLRLEAIVGKRRPIRPDRELP